MNRLLRCCVPVLCAGLMPILSATAQDTPPAATAPAPPPGARAPQKPKNLKVLPDNTDLRKVMREYSGALGVECEFCHAAADPVTHRSDRASDANPVKDKARYMIQMNDDLNKKYLAQMPNRHDDADPITCGTCHRGEKHPSVFVAPPRPEGNRPPGMQPGAAPAATPPGN
jgi:Photosynthetic reaction centre cytochrome C subunit